MARLRPSLLPVLRQAVHVCFIIKLCSPRITDSNETAAVPDADSTDDDDDDEDEDEDEDAMPPTLPFRTDDERRAERLALEEGSRCADFRLSKV